MYLLGLDFEATGLDTDKDLVTEIGAVLWDWDRKQPIALCSEFMKLEGGAVLTEEIIQKTGVVPEYLEKFGLSQERGLTLVHKLIAEADVVVAHNGSAYDRLMLKSWYGRVSVFDDSLQFDQEKLWIDTQLDLELADGASRRLTYMAADHGFLNPFAHRAVFDVLTMMRILSQYDLETVMYSARQPLVVLQAMISYDDREKAKEKKFYWDAPNKRWIKQLKQHKAAAEAAACDFKTRVLLV